MAKSRIILCLAAIFLTLSGCDKEESKPLVVHSGADLQGHTVATLAGSCQDMYLESIHADYTTYQTKADVIAAVTNRKADCFLLDGTDTLCVDMGKAGLQTAGFIEELAAPVAGGIKKGGARTDEIKKSFDDFFAHFLAADSNAYSKLVQRWSSKRPDTISMPHFDLPQEGDEIVVGYTDGNMPFGFLCNGQMVGAEVELIQRWSEYSGYRIRTELYPFNSLIAALQTGKIDIILSNLVVTEEREKSITFTTPYFTCDAVVACRTEKQGSSTGFIQWVTEGFQNNVIAEDRWKMILDGLWETVVISFWSLIFGTLLGCGICAMRMSRNRFSQSVAKGYINLMRGIPILVLLMILFYVVFSQAGISGRLVAIVAFSLNFAAYVSEMFRNGIESVDKGQREAGMALGFTKVQTFLLIIVPQALRRIIPVYKGEAVSLIKNTSIVGYIAIQDLTKVSDIIRSRTFDAFFPLLVITIIYIILAWLLGMLIDRIKVR